MTSTQLGVGDKESTATGDRHRWAAVSAAVLPFLSVAREAARQLESEATGWELWSTTLIRSDASGARGWHVDNPSFPAVVIITVEGSSYLEFRGELDEAVHMTAGRVVAFARAARWDTEHRARASAGSTRKALMFRFGPRATVA